MKMEEFTTIVISKNCLLGYSKILNMFWILWVSELKNSIINYTQKFLQRLAENFCYSLVKRMS